MNEKSRSSRGEPTRDALLDAATDAFARFGFEAANLRQIAEAAGVNPALIGYHFKGKEGLYLAVFERILVHMAGVVEPLLARIETGIWPASPEQDRRERALELLLAMLEAVLTRLVHLQPAWGTLVVREMSSPTTAFDLLYGRLIGRGQRALVSLLQVVRDEPDSERLRLLAATIFAQMLLVRHARAPFMRLLGWERIGDRELAALVALLRRNVTLIALGD